MRADFMFFFDSLFVISENFCLFNAKLAKLFVFLFKGKKLKPDCYSTIKILKNQKILKLSFTLFI